MPFTRSTPTGCAPPRLASVSRRPWVACRNPRLRPGQGAGSAGADYFLIRHALTAGEDWRESVQAGAAWVGRAVAEALGLDVNRQRDAAKIKSLLKLWTREGLLVKKTRASAKGKGVPYVVVGRRADA